MDSQEKTTFRLKSEVHWSPYARSQRLFTGNDTCPPQFQQWKYLL